ncbi:hypothetical protein BGX28_002140 [Mortierella sp. GBA30]|nr:hypothetical protein BGX28_002140 [Mortierella sp. GBA30]
MVRQSRSSKAYRNTDEAPDTPRTPQAPHTPRSPHLHRSRIVTPTSSSRAALKRQHTEDMDMEMTDNMPSKLAHLPSANPTPSEILSMDLNTLALGGNSESCGLRTMMATPSARLSDDAIERYNLTLPFSRLPNSSPSRIASKSSLESVHRTQTRETALDQVQQHQQSNAFSTPVKSRAVYKDRAGMISPGITQRAALLSPPRSQPIADEENNIFLTRSPRAIRTPRRALGRISQPPLLAEKASPFSDTMSQMTASVASAVVETHTGLFQGDPALEDLNEDDTLETESQQSSQGDFEKENHTPKAMDDSTNPFLVGTMADPKRYPRYSKAEGCTTPTGPSSGSITRSRRLALGSISPWRWNSFDEHTSLLALANSNSKGKSLGLLDGSCGIVPSKTDHSVSDWVESTQHPKGSASESAPGNTADLTSTASGSSSSASSSSSSSSLSSSMPSPSSTPGATLKFRQGAGTRYPSATAPSALYGPPIGTKGKLPDHHPNSAEAAERKGGPSSIVAKLTETVIQPHSVAFNRRAQQVAGRIYYWKHGSYHLVSDQDKQQWPGEWKFEVFQDPESPGAPSAKQGESSLFGTTSALYHGKGKMTDRQLSGPASKRLRVHRDASNGGSPVHPDSEPPERVAVTLTTTTSTTATRSVAARLVTDKEKDSTPPSSPSKRGSRLRQEANRSVRQARLQDRYDFRERRMLNEPLAQRSRRCGA